MITIPSARHISEILKFYDVEFLECTYQSILGRASDENGRDFYLAQLRKGASRLNIITQIRCSPEGKKYLPMVLGLDEEIKKFKISNLLFIGPIFRKIWKIDGKSSLQIRLRVLEGKVFYLSPDDRYQLKKQKTLISICNINKPLEDLETTNMSSECKKIYMKLKATKKIILGNPL